MLASTEIKPPTPSQLKTLTLEDLVLMNKLSVSMREQIKKFVQIDPFTTRDPLEENDDYEYSVILDKFDIHSCQKQGQWSSIALGFHTWK